VRIEEVFADAAHTITYPRIIVVDLSPDAAAADGGSVDLES